MRETLNAARSKCGASTVPSSASAARRSSSPSPRSEPSEPRAGHARRSACVSLRHGSTLRPPPGRRLGRNAQAMTKWVYAFGDGKAEGEAGMKNLLGGKGANLAEMSNLGLPVPPGFTLTTAVCTAYYDNGRAYPDGLEAEVEQALEAVGRIAGLTFGDARNPLLVSVRSGARASMPGMMDTVLNLGLNDANRRGGRGGDRRRALRLGFLPPLHHHVLGRGARRGAPPLRGGARRLQGAQGLRPRHGPDGRRLAGPRPPLQAHRREGARQALPAGSARAALGRHRRGVRLLDERAGEQIPRAARHPGELGHGGQRPGHGVRQPRRDLRHRRRLHPQPLDRREASSTASS